MTTPPPRMHRLPVLLILLVFSPAALAWSVLGHRLVGDLAERHVRPATAIAIHALLTGEPEPTLAGVAQWADDLRTTDLERFKRTSRWHYVNVSSSTCHYDPARDCPNDDCAVAAIQAQRTILGDRQEPREKRRDALKFLVHFVGDIHQPLHAGNRRDKGGNQFQVSLRTGLAPEAYARNRYVDGVMGTNLHAVWDYYILAAPGLDARDYAARLAAAPWPPLMASGGSPDAWASESCTLLDTHDLYPATHTLDRSYLDAQRPLAELRIRQAAYRLARLLDDTLGY